MSEELGANKVSKNGSVSLPPDVLEKLGINKGEDFVGFKDQPDDDKVTMTTIEVDY